MFAGTALSVHLFVCAGLSLFIIYGPYLYVVVCVSYAYNLTLQHCLSTKLRNNGPCVFDVSGNNNFCIRILCAAAVNKWHKQKQGDCTCIHIYILWQWHKEN